MMDAYQQVIYKSRYARWLDSEKRRENWDETVMRTVTQLEKQALKSGSALAADDVNDIYHAIYNLEVMPSMRLIMTAGEAVERDNIAAYNCAYMAINNKRKFSEALYILMNGTGVGFSCERQEISKLPTLPAEMRETDDTIVVGDSKLGWAKAFKKLLSMLWEGDIPKVDYSKIRPAGERLKTFGGRASGPKPLRELFEFVVHTFYKAAGRKLTSVEVHDIMCKIGEIVVVGGVRRSALISLSNLSDTRMRNAKAGEWWIENKQRALANNSAVYDEKPDSEVFLEEWLSLVKSKSGERGIFNREAAKKQVAKYGKRNPNYDFGCNPCSEILLRDAEFCNLTEVVVRYTDTQEDLVRKVRVASIIGTLQSTMTEFQFLSEEWKRNCEEERLLGVSLTGIYDHPVLKNANEECAEWLQLMREQAELTNGIYAELLGINCAAAITCVKPSGTVSQLVNCASGIHPRHAEHYIRNVRMDKKDPMCQYLVDQGVVHEPDYNYPDNTMVFSFPQSSPTGAVTRNDVTAIQHLELWLHYQRHWAEHKPSVTINVDDEEWAEVGGWVYKHFDEMSGVAFLPKLNHTYKQAPYIDATAEEIGELAAKTPSTLDWTLLVEEQDETKGSQELACTGGACEVSFL